MTAALELRAVTKAYAGSTAAHPVDLAVPPGRVHGALGPNGAGKTTLLGIAVGMVRPDDGEVRLLGRPLQFGRRLPTGVAGCVDNPRFPPYLTARQVLAIAADLEDRLQLVGLTEVADRPTGGFSLGLRSGPWRPPCSTDRPC